MDYTPSLPENEKVSLAIIDREPHLEITDFEEYSFLSHFETNTDGWSYSFGTSRLDDRMRSAIVPGAKLQLRINSLVQSTGYIDSVETNPTRTGGTAYHIEGRDLLAQVVDGSADPTRSFKEGATLEQAIVQLFTPFGWSSPDQFQVDAIADREIKSGSLRGTPRSKKKGKPLKNFVLHQLRPQAHEGVFDFAMRMASRFGLWIWLSATGEQVIVSTPDFEQEAFQKLIRDEHGNTNVLEMPVRRNISEQPSLMVADGHSQSAEFGRSAIRAYAYNPSIRVAGPIVDPVVEWPGCREVVLPSQSQNNVMSVPKERIMWLHDDESTTLEQLEYYLRRQMSHQQRKALSVPVTVEGHGQMTPRGFIPWVVDTTVDVDDSVSGLVERLWVLSRRFTKARRGGTKTQLELIRLNTIVY